MEPIGNVRHERSFIRFGHITDIFNIQQIGYTNLLRCYLESESHIASMITLVQGIVINKIRSVNIEQSATKWQKMLVMQQGKMLPTVEQTYKASPSFQLA